MEEMIENYRKMFPNAKEIKCIPYYTEEISYFYRDRKVIGYEIEIITKDEYIKIWSRKL